MNKKIVQDALVLTAFTLVLGFILGWVYEITKTPIAAAEEATTQAAYKEVFENAASFEAYAAFSEEEAAALMEASAYMDEIEAVQTAMDENGNPLGYVITVTAKDASQANITFSVGITNEGIVNGYSITSISETPGLGDKVKTEEFASQFAGKGAESFTVVKQTPAAENEIESVSGATISSKAITNGVNACMTYFRTILEGGAAHE